MDVVNKLRAKRAANRIPGRLLAARLKISASKLSAIENSYVSPTPQQLLEIGQTIDLIVSERAQIAALAEEHGLSLAGAGF